MSEQGPLKPRIDFIRPLHEDETVTLKAAKNFSTVPPERFIVAQEEQESEEMALTAVLYPPRRLWRRVVFVAVILAGISVIAQGIQWLLAAWQQHAWATFGVGIAGLLIVMAGTGALLAEWRHLYQLRQRAEERETGRALLYSHANDKGREFCEKLARQVGIDGSHPALQRWQASLHETHSDREVVTLYAQLVQPVTDRLARREISRCAAESALIIAVSPLAVVDMAFIAWRNLRLINRIAAIYGIRLGRFSRIRLFRLVLLNIAFAGASELVREIGLDWLSQDVAARLSARVAQGLGAGLLTARLGVKAMELCRPLPWRENEKPRLGDFRRELTGQLKEAMHGATTKNATQPRQ